MDRYLYGRSISVGLNEGETPAEAQPWLVGGAPGAQEEALAALPAYGLAPQMPGDTPLTFALRDQVMSVLGAAVGMEIPAIGEGREEENMTRAQLAQDLTLFDDGQ